MNRTLVAKELMAIAKLLTAGRKIDLYLNNEYLASTTQSQTCKEAVQRILDLAKKGPVSIAGKGAVHINPNKDVVTARFA